jgi:hypothetical protein
MRQALPQPFQPPFLQTAYASHITSSHLCSSTQRVREKKSFKKTIQASQQQNKKLFAFAYVRRFSFLDFHQFFF